MTSNTKRALSELVSVDAWHMKFCEGVETADLHVEVSFGDARLGGDNKAPVQFTVKVMRATVAVILPSSGALRVERSSIAREELPELEISNTKARKTKGSAKADFSLNPTKFMASLAGAGSIESDTQSTVKSDGTVRGALVRHYRNDDGHECWDVTPAIAKHLLNRIWDGAADPRFSMKDKRSATQKAKDEANQMDPVVSVQIRCKREDLLIENIKVTDPEKEKELGGRRNQDKRLIAAESHIRDLLMMETLGAPNLKSDYVEMVLADIIAEAE